MTTARRGNSLVGFPGIALVGLGVFSSGCAGFSSEAYDGGAGETADGPPLVVSVSPADGSTGVSADTPVVVTFSEPVDAASAAAAVHISGIPNDTLDVSLDPSGTTLTVTPRRGFAYANGTDPEATTAERYTVTIGPALTDLDGTPLAEPFRASFHTLRRITAEIANSASGEYYTYAVAVDGSVNVCSDPSTTFPVGHTLGLAVSGDHLGIAAFENALPEGVVGVESATFSGHQAAASGAFYEGGIVSIEEIPFQIFDATVAGAPVLTELGPFVTSGSVERPKYDVTTAVADGVAHGTRSFMYRLGSMTWTDNTFANFYCDGFTLAVTYLVP